MLGPVSQTTETWIVKRKLSWVLAALALVVVPLWARLQASADVAAQRDAHHFVCGMPLLAIYLLALIGSCLFSVGALGLGIPAYRALASSRSKLRMLELFVLGLPLIAAGLVALGIWVSMSRA